MTRTTLDLDDGVLRELEARSDREHKPLGVIASELLARALAHEPDPGTDRAELTEPTDADADAGAEDDPDDPDDRDARWAALGGN